MKVSARFVKKWCLCMDYHVLFAVIYANARYNTIEKYRKGTRAMQKTPKKNKRRGRWGRVVAIILLVVTVLSAGGITIGAVCLSPYMTARMDPSLMELAVANEPTTLYAYMPTARQDRQGPLHPAPSATLTAPERRILVQYDEIPADLIHAFVAIEDKRFWKHSGVDLFRTARAGVRYLFGNATFGASTITQQLIKNLTGHDELTADRKLTEIFMAWDLERQVNKPQILETYLNIINLAGGCHGVGAAAERYYSKDVSSLTLPECATIAAITNNPARYNPLTHPAENRARRDLILREMAAQGYITERDRDEAIDADLGLVPSESRSASAPITSWYADMVAADVIRDLTDRLGYTRDYASRLVYNGGLSIETAMDEQMQAIVDAYYSDLSHFPVGENGRPQSSCILIDPATGDILAVAGAVGEKTANRLQNYATDTRRPSGSCIKPLSVYAPALEKGLITWASIYEDTPITVRNGISWPANADGRYRGNITVGTALADSVNTVAVRILGEVGNEASFSFLRNKVGLHSLIPQEKSVNDLTVSSLALGQQSYGVTARELTAAYTAFSDGIYRAPVSYHRVLDANGHVLLENRPAGEANRALSPENAALMTRLLMTVTERGTAARYMTVDDTLGIEVAGKTGTTQNNCDRWFIGYTPRLLAGVWMGYDYPTELRGINGNPCASIWDDLITTCETHYNATDLRASFPISAKLTELDFCPESGCRLNPYCTDPSAENAVIPEHGWFIRGTEPLATCHEHEEPPIIIIPHDASDPDRIPGLPNDIMIIPPKEPVFDKRWLSRWFSRRSRL